MHNEKPFIDENQWVIWNASLGIADTVTIGEIETTSDSRNAWLEEPYDMVGPFNLDTLETEGQISFAACVVMSQQKWQNEQAVLRQQSRQQKRASQQRVFEEYARSNQRRWQQQTQQYQLFDEQRYRQILNLPNQGQLLPAQIKTAYRRLAQKSHPDTGGSHEQFVTITKARDALLERHQKSKR